MEKEGYNKINYNNEYNKKNYVIKNLTIPIKEYNDINNYRIEKGYKSFNSFVMELIRREMNEDKGKISIGDINQSGDNNNIQIKG